MHGIVDSLIASILYAAGGKFTRKFHNPLMNAVENTVVYFSKERGIELDQRKLESLMQGELGEGEINAFKSGERFLDGEKLARQFADLGGLYLEDESQIQDISNEIFSYFKSAFTNELLRNPDESIQNLNSILSLQFEIAHVEREKIRLAIQDFQETWAPRIDVIDQNVQFLVARTKVDDERRVIQESIRTKYADFKIVDANYWDTISTLFRKKS